MAYNRLESVFHQEPANVSLHLSARVQRVKVSPTMAVTAKAAELKAAGRDVIGLGAGEPDFDTPEHIKQAGIVAILAGRTKYTAVGGTTELKQAIAEKFRRDNQLDYGLDQIMVSSGGKQCCYNLAQVLLGPGDQAVIPAPYWVSYPDMVQLADGAPIFIETDIAARYKITPGQLDAALGPRTRMMFLNSPSNPAGTAYTRTELAALGEVLRGYPDVVIGTDDMYEHILWAGEPFCNIVMACPELRERTVILHGVSKAYAMTGWRIGYCAGPEALIKAMSKVQSQSTSGPSSISQAAAVAALAGDQDCIAPMLKAFKQRHDFVVERLGAIPGIAIAPGDGTFYAFPDCRDLIDRLDGIADDVALAEYLLEEAGVALVPGSAFGTPGCLRLSFATSLEVLSEAMDRLHRSLA